MFTVIKAHYAGNEKSYVQAVCKTGDTKDTDGIANGSICFNMETSVFSMFDEGAGDWTDLD